MAKDITKGVDVDADNPMKTGRGWFDYFLLIGATGSALLAGWNLLAKPVGNWFTKQGRSLSSGVGNAAESVSPWDRAP